MKLSAYNIYLDRGSSVYIFNGVSGGLLAISREDYEALLGRVGGGDARAVSPELWGELARGRMLLSDRFDELAFLKDRYKASCEDRSRPAFTVITSLGCNFACPYCYEAKHPSRIDDEVASKILAVVDDKLPTIKALSMTWSGGEPLLAKDRILSLSDALIARCEVAGVKYDAGIITNGYLLDAGTCEQLRDRHVRQAQITLDGPPDVHDRMRPLAGGGGTFWRILANLQTAARHFQVLLRVNTDRANFDRLDELLQILAGHDLAGKISLYPGQLSGFAANPSAPSAGYDQDHQCFRRAEFGEVELAFTALAARFGFYTPALPRPRAAPCVAVMRDALVVGSRGELYRCWESVGYPTETIGDIRDYRHLRGGATRWLEYDAFSEEECRSCVALPVCMGGCAARALQAPRFEDRCTTFRFTYREEVLRFIEHAEAAGASA